MNKKLKISLYCILGIILVLVLCLMIWWSKHNAWEPDISQEDTWEVIVQATWDISNDNENTQDKVQNPEQDILNDLESFFNNSNGYENVQWDFWFINAEN